MIFLSICCKGIPTINNILIYDIKLIYLICLLFVILTIFLLTKFILAFIVLILFLFLYRFVYFQSTSFTIIWRTRLRRYLFFCLIIYFLFEVSTVTTLYFIVILKVNCVNIFILINICT